MEATYTHNNNLDGVVLFYEDQTEVESFSKKRGINDLINQLCNTVNIESEESYKTCDYSITPEETDLSKSKLNTQSKLLFNNNIDKKNMFSVVFISLLKEINPNEEIVYFLIKDNKRICIDRKAILNQKRFYSPLNYLQPQPQVEVEAFKYEEFDFPVKVKPRESFKIRIKVNSIRSNQLNPRLELD